MRGVHYDCRGVGHTGLVLCLGIICDSRPVWELCFLHAVRYSAVFATRSQTLQPWSHRASWPAPRQLAGKYMQTGLATHLLHLRCIVLNLKWFYQYLHELTVSPFPAMTRGELSAHIDSVCGSPEAFADPSGADACTEPGESSLCSALTGACCVAPASWTWCDIKLLQAIQ